MKCEIITPSTQADQPTFKNKMLDVRHPKSCSSSISSESDAELLLERSMECLVLEKQENIPSSPLFPLDCCFHSESILREDNPRIQRLASIISQGKGEASHLCKKCELKEAAICSFCNFIHCRKHLLAHFHNCGHFLAVDLVSFKPLCLHCSSPEKDQLTSDTSTAIATKSAQNLPGKLISGIISCFQDSNEVQVEKTDADPWLQPVVKGMLNKGNTCYFNSTIQALRNNPILSKFLAERAHFFPASGVFRALYALFQQFDKKKVVDASAFIKLFSKTWKPIRGKGQQDPHEFLTLLLGALVEESERCDEEDREVLKQDFKRIFLGSSTVRVECENCSHVSTHNENFSSLTLPLCPETMLQALNLDRLLQTFTDNNTVDSFACEKCKQRGISLSIRPLQLPDVLFINFKRFSAFHNGKGSATIEKNHQFVEFGSYLQFPSFPDEYELQAVIVHIGHNYEHGHCISYFKKGEFWFYSSDATVNKVPFTEVQNSRAYVLVYNKLRL